MVITRTRRFAVGLLAAVLACAVVLTPAPAAAEPGFMLSDGPGAGLAGAEAVGPPAALAPAHVGTELVITGEPTADERLLIEQQWRRFATAFAGYSECMGPIEVKVVARAEDWYSSRNVGPIAAFYRLPPAAIVFVEHGKVRPDVLIHEFAHHLDVSCGLGSGPVGEAFRFAAGITSGKGWMSGTSWKNVPAEVFAEAIVAYFDEKAVIDVDEDAVVVIDQMSLTPDPNPPEPGLFQAALSTVTLLRAGGSPIVVAASASVSD
jgi:hypothetical protein